MFNAPGFEGLLTEQDQQQAKQMAMLQAGLAMMAAGGQRGLNRQSLGQAIATGGMTGLNAYQQALMQGPKRKMMALEAQKAQMELDTAQQMKDIFAGGQPAGGTDEKARAKMYRDAAARIGPLDAGKAEALLRIADRLDPERYEPLSGDEAKTMGLPEGNKYQINRRTGQLTVLDSGSDSGVFGGSQLGKVAQEFLRQYGDTPENRLKLANWLATQPQYQQVTDAEGNIRFVPVPGSPPPQLSRAAPQAAAGQMPQGQAAPPAAVAQAPSAAPPATAPRPTVGGQLPPGVIGQRPLSEGERTAAGYAERMRNAQGILAAMEEQGGAPTYPTSIAGSLPLVGEAARRAVETPQQQQYRQAQEDWVRAKLRKESGAVIGAEEMAQEIRTYFPQPGESPEVIKQKRLARDIATQAMVRGAGNAMPSAARPSAAPQSAPQGKPTKRWNPNTGRLEDM